MQCKVKQSLLSHIIWQIVIASLINYSSAYCALISKPISASVRRLLGKLQVFAIIKKTRICKVNSLHLLFWSRNLAQNWIDSWSKNRWIYWILPMYQIYFTQHSKSMRFTLLFLHFTDRKTVAFWHLKKLLNIFFR